MMKEIHTRQTPLTEEGINNYSILDIVKCCGLPLYSDNKLTLAVLDVDRRVLDPEIYKSATFLNDLTTFMKSNGFDETYLFDDENRRVTIIKREDSDAIWNIINFRRFIEQYPQQCNIIREIAEKEM